MKLFLLKASVQRIFLLLLGFLLYFSALDNWFSGFAGDDDWMVYENLQVFNLSIENISGYFSSFYGGQYSPVNTLAYGVIYHFFGINPLYFHGFSLILHLGNTLLVFELIRRLVDLRGGNTSEPLIRAHSSLIAFVTALLCGLDISLQGPVVFLLLFSRTAFVPAVYRYFQKGVLFPGPVAFHTRIRCQGANGGLPAGTGLTGLVSET